MYLGGSYLAVCLMEGVPPVVLHQLLCFNEVPESALHTFWGLESIGICDAPIEAADVSTIFKQQLKYVDDRYEVGFQWKPGMADTLHDNDELARLRLDSLCWKMDKDADLACIYDSALHEMENDGIMEEVPDDQKVSLHATYNDVSLNDFTEAGPHIMPNLLEILIRFRRRQISLTADITKAFLYEKSDSDRYVSRLL